MKGEQQSATAYNTLPLLSNKETKYVQQVFGIFLYYARTLDFTRLPALNTIGTQQAIPTQNTLKKCQ